ncbi:MAG TPA: cellulose biosynthesis protein BcsN [Roseiarcus sp.]|nr:cellulose biosynthesis protein BcsN [Roseiarcus sp.]
MTRLWLALLAASLSGCAGGTGVGANYQSLAVVGEPEKAHEVDKSDLLARIPAWAGDLKRARQYREAGLVRQEIVFSGGTLGDHTIEVTVAERGVSSERLHRPTDNEIEDELAARFPGVAMKIVPGEGQDAPGADRVAIGRASDGTRCLYDWRWANDVRLASDPSGIAAVAAAFSQKTTPASLRVRLCSKYVSLDDLASLARQIQFAPLADIDRIVDGLAPKAEAIKPVQVGALAPTLESALACTGGAPTLPRAKYSPPHSEKRQAHRAPPANLSASYAAETGGARFLAAPPIAAPVAKPVEPAAGRVATGLRDLDLPAAAFRGPAGAGTTAPTLATQ